MEYTVDQLSRLSGISARTLRYYDQIGLLKPARVRSSGYRIYGSDEVNRLQQILLYREMDMALSDIRQVLDAPDFDVAHALRAHLTALELRRARIERLISTVKNTLNSQEEGKAMDDHQKFEGFKRQLVEDNELRHGREARERYGEAAVDESNRKLMNMTKAQYDAMQQAATELQARLERAVQDGLDPTGDEGGALCALHKAWLSYTWPQYTAEAHKGLTQMYVCDERFTAHYDQKVAGCAAFLHDAVHAHAH
ncbi:MerR family transcriptional regulator [Bacillota bacterium Meth-B3]|nr:MerR family transcriptional regulator [Christensenellaceae bacterium]